MTEKDLYKYRDAIRDEKRWRDRLEEIEGRQSPRSAIGSPTPPSHSGDTSSRLVSEIERADAVKQKLDTAINLSIIAETRILEVARAHLRNDAEQVVFDTLYRGIRLDGRKVFPTIREAASYIGYSLQSVYRLRKDILEVVAPL